MDLPMIGIEKILEPFSLSIGRKKDFLNLLKVLRNNKITMDELINYLEDMKKKHIEAVKEDNRKLIKEQKQWNRIALKCPNPDCKSPMKLFPVNTQKGDQTGDNSKSVWACINRKCMHTIYNTQTVQEILNQLRGKL